MSRIFGFVIGAIWIVFTFMAVRASSAGAAADQPDAAFWWTVIAVFYGIAALVAIIGTARHRYRGPRKYSP